MLKRLLLAIIIVLLTVTITEAKNKKSKSSSRSKKVSTSKKSSDIYYFIIIKIKPVKKKANSEDYYNFISDSYPIDEWFMDDTNTIQSKNQYAFFSKDPWHVIKFFQETCSPNFVLQSSVINMVPSKKWRKIKAKFDAEM